MANFKDYLNRFVSLGKQKIATDAKQTGDWITNKVTGKPASFRAAPDPIMSLAKEVGGDIKRKVVQSLPAKNSPIMQKVNHAVQLTGTQPYSAAASYAPVFSQMIKSKLLQPKAITSPLPDSMPHRYTQAKQPSVLGATNNMATPMPTARPLPTATPIPSSVNRIDPIQPQNIPQTYYTNRNSKIEPKLWDAIMTASPTGDLQLNDYMKRMALALSTQESGGGYQLEGDNGQSNGPYHIQRANVPVADRYSPEASTNLVFQEMIRNMMKNNVPKERSLRTWNWNSGYANNGPRYNVDIPEMATTSSFYRGQ